MPEHSGLKRISLAYRCGGSAGLITEVTHRLPFHLLRGGRSTWNGPDGNIRTVSSQALNDLD